MRHYSSFADLRSVLRDRIDTDLVCVLFLTLLSWIATWQVYVTDAWVVMDPITFFYPMYSFLGERLRAGDIPGWNPHQFAGAPFAADPQSGWTYAPAMLLFTLLPMELAAVAYIALHWMLSGVALYGFARVLGMGRFAALIAATGYELNGFLFERNVCCPPYMAVAAWLPVALLCGEMAIRDRRWLDRGLWWGAAGFALSQSLAGWLGQGAYYALLAFGGFVAYRTLVAPPSGSLSLSARLPALLLHGAAMLLFAFGLAAAGLLPRLEFNSLSSLADGYRGVEHQLELGGWGLSHWSSLLDPLGSKYKDGAYTNALYLGGVTFALALVAPLLAGARFAVPYWSTLSLGALILSGQGPTPLHSLLYLLPRFAELHPHYPDRVMMVFYPGAALLAGATVSSIVDRRDRRIALAGLVPLLGALGLWHLSAPIPRASLVALIFGAALLSGYALLKSRRQLISVVLLLVLLTDLLVANEKVVARGGTINPARRVAGGEWNAVYVADEMGRLMPEHQGAHPTRIFVYRPGGRLLGELMEGNIATVMGLQDIQGYNPLHLARFDEFVTALNRRSQPRYRRSYIFAEGLDSPLLDLLNVRYFLTAREAQLPQAIRAAYPVRHENNGVQVRERPSALPRAWIVHSARQVARGQALPLLSEGTVNPRQTVLLEEPPPPLPPSPVTSADRVLVTMYEPDHVRLHTYTRSPAMLVLSEIYYPAWKAFVDGHSAPLFVANHTLRAIPVPSGEHTIDLRFESRTLNAGLTLTGLFYGVLVALALTQMGRHRAAASK